MYFRYPQVLMMFAEAFANGFVLENEPICRETTSRRLVRLGFRGVQGLKRWELGGLECRFILLIPKLTPTHPTINVTRHAEC